MRLISATISGYKRFGAATELQVYGPLVAIVGPNEAGKTSLLRALEHLSRDARFTRTEYTGRRVPDGNPAIVSADFLVEQADRDMLGGLLDDAVAYRLTAAKGPRNDTCFWSLNPPLYRDASPRDAYRAELDAVIADERLILRSPPTEDDEELEPETALHDQATDILRRLASADEDLDSARIDELRAFAEALRGDPPAPGTDTAVRLAEATEALLAHEETENPHEIAKRELTARAPSFLFFDSDHRSLRTDYEWTDFAEAPPALDNLFHLAGLNYAEYREVALNRERRDELTTMERRANLQLEREFAVWTQAQLTVQFRADAQGMQLHVFDKKTLKDVPFDQRSQGLRSFVALIAFTARYRHDVAPILLIDEAESHLHYGGQADLIQVFERQKLAQTIIYTTHSIGCLPEDLGTTIRVVAQLGDERSAVRNSFWADASASVGLTPLMLAMGAELLAFTPSRFALIGEGPTEAIILPSLFREARAAEYAGTPLGFQVAPGVARVSKAAAADLELDAGNVVYLVDADDGGLDNADKLADRVKEEGRFLVLGDANEDGLCTEDFIDLDLYVEAVNAVLSRPEESTRLAIADLPSAGRPKGVEAWCETEGVDAPAKTDVALMALQLARDSGRPLVEATRRDDLAKLYQQVRDLLRPAT